MSSRNLTDLILVGIIYLFIVIFVLLPVFAIAADSLSGPSGLTFDYFTTFFSRSFYLRITANSMILSILTVVATSLVAVPLAYMLARYDIKHKTLLRTLLLGPMIAPPFVGAIALINLFGTNGTVNIILTDWLKITRGPIDFLGGLPGLVFLESLHLYPLLLLNAEAAFSSISRDVEEVAELHGASGAVRFFRVTLPLAVPGWLTGALLVFIFTFSDWVTPLILRQPQYIASEVYASISEGYGLDPNLYRLGLVGTIIIALVAVSSLLGARWFIERRRYNVKGVGRQQKLGGLKRRLFYLLSVAVVTLGLLPLVWIFLRAVSGRWFLTAFPTQLTVSHFNQLYSNREVSLAVWNSVSFAVLAFGITMVLGVVIAYVLTRTNVPGLGFLDSLVTFVIVMPGIVIGIGYLLSFSGPSFPLARQWFVMPLVVAVHRLPFVVRSAYAAFISLDRSVEEVAYVLGAGRRYTMGRITLRLTSRAITAGGLFSLVYGLQELSALIFLYKPGTETITIQMFLYALSGANIEVAAAMGVVLIVVVGLFIALAFRLSERVTSYQIG